MECRDICDVAEQALIAGNAVLSGHIVQALCDMTSHKLQQKLFHLFCTDYQLFQNTLRACAAGYTVAPTKVHTLVWAISHLP